MIETVQAASNLRNQKQHGSTSHGGVQGFGQQQNHLSLQQQMQQQQQFMMQTPSQGTNAQQSIQTNSGTQKNTKSHFHQYSGQTSQSAHHTQKKLSMHPGQQQAMLGGVMSSVTSGNNMGVGLSGQNPLGSGQQDDFMSQLNSTLENLAKTSINKEKKLKQHMTNSMRAQGAQDVQQQKHSFSFNKSNTAGTTQGQSQVPQSASQNQQNVQLNQVTTPQDLTQGIQKIKTQKLRQLTTNNKIHAGIDQDTTPSGGVVPNHINQSMMIKQNMNPISQASQNVNAIQTPLIYQSYQNTQQTTIQRDHPTNLTIPNTVQSSGIVQFASSKMNPSPLKQMLQSSQQPTQDGSTKHQAQTIYKRYEGHMSDMMLNSSQINANGSVQQMNHTENSTKQVIIDKYINGGVVQVGSPRKGSHSNQRQGKQQRVLKKDNGLQKGDEQYEQEQMIDDDEMMTKSSQFYDPTHQNHQIQSGLQDSATPSLMNKMNDQPLNFTNANNNNQIKTQQKPSGITTLILPQHNQSQEYDEQDQMNFNDQNGLTTLRLRHNNTNSPRIIPPNQNYTQESALAIPNSVEVNYTKSNKQIKSTHKNSNSPINSNQQSKLKIQIPQLGDGRNLQVNIKSPKHSHQGTISSKNITQIINANNIQFQNLNPIQSNQQNKQGSFMPDIHGINVQQQSVSQLQHPLTSNSQLVVSNVQNQNVNAISRNSERTQQPEGQIKEDLKQVMNSSPQKQENLHSSPSTKQIINSRPKKVKLTPQTTNDNNVVHQQVLTSRPMSKKAAQNTRNNNSQLPPKAHNIQHSNTTTNRSFVNQQKQFTFSDSHNTAAVGQQQVQNQTQDNSQQASNIQQSKKKIQEFSEIMIQKGIQMDGKAQNALGANSQGLNKSPNNRKLSNISGSQQINTNQPQQQSIQSNSKFKIKPMVNGATPMDSINAGSQQSQNNYQHQQNSINQNNNARGSAGANHSSPSKIKQKKQFQTQQDIVQQIDENLAQQEMMIENLNSLGKAINTSSPNKKHWSQVGSYCTGYAKKKQLCCCQLPTEADYKGQSKRVKLAKEALEEDRQAYPVLIVNMDGAIGYFDENFKYYFRPNCINHLITLSLSFRIVAISSASRKHIRNLLSQLKHQQKSFVFDGVYQMAKPYQKNNNEGNYNLTQIMIDFGFKDLPMAMVNKVVILQADREQHVFTGDNLYSYDPFIQGQVLKSPVIISVPHLRNKRSLSMDAIYQTLVSLLVTSRFTSDFEGYTAIQSSQAQDYLQDQSSQQQKIKNERMINIMLPQKYSEMQSKIQKSHLIQIEDVDHSLVDFQDGFKLMKKVLSKKNMDWVSVFNYIEQNPPQTYVLSLYQRKEGNKRLTEMPQYKFQSEDGLQMYNKLYQQNLTLKQHVQAWRTEYFDAEYCYTSDEVQQQRQAEIEQYLQQKQRGDFKYKLIRLISAQDHQDSHMDPSKLVRLQEYDCSDGKPTTNHLIDLLSQKQRQIIFSTTQAEHIKHVMQIDKNPEQLLQMQEANEKQNKKPFENQYD